MTLGRRYELRAPLGSGSMAQVIEAHDVVLDRDVAIKLLRTESADAEGIARFVREARIAASLSHPHVVRIFDAGEEDGRLYLVMELVRGPNLAYVLKRVGPLGVRQAVALTDQVLGALAAAHERGLVHRDVKPGNILFADDRTVKLADFGLAKTVQDPSSAVTRPGQVVGTPMYLAPERSEGRGASPASDLYSVGIVLFEMLAGKPPFTGRSLLELAIAHQQAPVPPIPRTDVPEAVEALMLHALACDPDARPSSARAMQEALRRATRPDVQPRLAAAGS
ncbi:MAG TPA: serine/threonine-protein kinase [Acidimicrobiia bacterium]|jgi:serine/threonine-protein kinase|nr:serine/threonine-protein kinase [Acidimicrobiia bacterium]